MMGRTHALTGWCAGLGIAPLLGHGDLAGAVLVGLVTAGFALLPDFDHRHSTASRYLGPLTGALSWILRKSSRYVYAITKGPRDEPVTGEHRHLSHTVLFAVLLGYFTAGATQLGGKWAVLGVAVFAVLLAEAALGDWVAVLSVGAVVWWLIQFGLDEALVQLDGLSGVLGIAVAVGCFVHCLGDSVTVSGCPFLFPLPIAGETWYELRPPKWLRFRTGGPVETMFMFPVVAVGALLLIPGAWTLVTSIIPAIQKLTQPGSG
ncbi:MAG: metal-dependent hydrolase [Umezawaea sp.]